MPDQPDAGTLLSEDEFLSLVDEEMPTEAAADTTDPEPTTPDPAADEADGTSTEPSEPATSAAKAEDREPAPETQPAVAAAAVPETPAPDAPARPTEIPGAKPFQFKAVGGIHTIPGVVELPDGSVVTPKEAKTELLRRLASERELSANFRRTQSQFTRDLTAAREARTAKDVEAEAVFKLFQDVKNMTPEQRWDYFQKFDEEAPRLELEIRRKQLEQERETLARQKAGPEVTPEERKEQVVTAATSALNETFARIAELPEVKGVIPQDKLIALYNRWVAKPDRLTRAADKDDPAQGIAKGDMLFDDSEVLDDVRYLLSVAPAKTPVPTPAPGTAGAPATPPSSAAVRNAALNADANPLPPVVKGGKVPVAPNPGKDEGKYKGPKGREQFKRDFMRGKLDAAD
jgi:hypothetical protein